MVIVSLLAANILHTMLLCTRKTAAAVVTLPQLFFRVYGLIKLWVCFESGSGYAAVSILG